MSSTVPSDFKSWIFSFRRLAYLKTIPMPGEQRHSHNRNMLISAMQSIARPILSITNSIPQFSPSFYLNLLASRSDSSKQRMSFSRTGPLTLRMIDCQFLSLVYFSTPLCTNSRSRWIWIWIWIWREAYACSIIHELNANLSYTSTGASTAEHAYYRPFVSLSCLHRGRRGPCLFAGGSYG